MHRNVQNVLTTSLIIVLIVVKLLQTLTIRLHAIAPLINIITLLKIYVFPAQGNVADVYFMQNFVLSVHNMQCSDITCHCVYSVLKVSIGTKINVHV